MTPKPPKGIATRRPETHRHCVPEYGVEMALADLRVEVEQLRVERDAEHNRTEMYRLEREAARDERDAYRLQRDALLVKLGEHAERFANLRASFSINLNHQVGMTGVWRFAEGYIKPGCDRPSGTSEDVARWLGEDVTALKTKERP